MTSCRSSIQHSILTSGTKEERRVHQTQNNSSLRVRLQSVALQGLRKRAASSIRGCPWEGHLQLDAAPTHPTAILP